MSAAPIIVSSGGGLVNEDGCGATGMLEEFCQLTKPGPSRKDGDRGAGTWLFCKEDAMLLQNLTSGMSRR